MISKHISEKEAFGSSTASKLGIDNIPNAQQLENIKLLAEKVFEPLREWVGSPIQINSIFRSKALNAAIPGSSNTSQHCADNGAAMDIDDNFGGATNAEMFNWIKDNLDFDQMIWEYGDDLNPDWVHVSYKATGNRNQMLRVKRINGKPVYTVI